MVKVGNSRWQQLMFEMRQACKQHIRQNPKRTSFRQQHQNQEFNRYWTANRIKTVCEEYVNKPQSKKKLPIALDALIKDLELLRRLYLANV
jgi:hypothetical protein